MKNADKTLMMLVDGELAAGKLPPPRHGSEVSTAHEQSASDWHLIGEALRQGTPPLRQAPDASFNAQILALIRTEDLHRAAKKPSSPGLTLRDLAWIGCACLVFAFGIMVSVTPTRSSHQLTEITSVRVPDVNLSATPIGREQRITILWTTGLEFLADHEFRLNTSQ